MRSVFTCSSCLALLVVTIFSPDTGAEHVRWGDPYHRIPKQAPITTHPHDLQKRGETCADGLYLCGSDVGGGCCSSNYACGTESCTATTINPQSVTCGTKVGYYGCPLSAGGGCCPVGLICSGESDCVAPAGESITDTSCPSKYTLCPSSVGYGCCMSGLLCGATACYRTVESFTTTLTTVDASGQTTILTSTASTTVTPELSILPSASEGQAVGLKYFPTSVPKESPINSSSGGLPTSTLGGLIGGGVALLIIIIIATIFVHRRLRHNEKIDSSKKSSSKGRTGRDGTTEYTVAKDENGSSTSANGNRTPRPRHDRTRSQSSEGGVGYSEFGQPSSSIRGGYNAVPTSASEGVRHPSIDSAPPGSYFDPRNGQQTAQPGYRYSTDSNPPSTIGTPYGHGGRWSVSSAPGEPYVVVPQELDSHHITPELPGSLGASPLNSPGLTPSPAAENRRRSSSLGQKPPPSHQNSSRRRSNSHQRGRSDSSSTGVPPPLGVVSENPEMHGFYGPTDRQVGQTAAGLQSGDASPTPGGSARTSFSVQR